MYTTRQANKIGNIKNSITKAEFNLDKFMDSDLSNSSVRAELRKALEEVSKNEEVLTAYLSDIKVA